MNIMGSDAFGYAKKKYGVLGVDLEQAIDVVSNTSISIHCWQGDDVTGFENLQKGVSGGGIQATGNFPGKARNINELRRDLEKVISLVPGKHKVALHVMYGDFGESVVDRNALEYSHFDSWVGWARENGIGLDFNSTLFAHPRADSGFTLSSKDPETRGFWVEHVKRCREVSAEIGKKWVSRVSITCGSPTG